MQEQYMRRAIELAQKGTGHTNPNPLVGAVIVKDGQVIGEGFHEAYGGLHAERNALKSCTEDPKGAELYVTLEPCCHYGKTPPCTEAVIKSGIRKVYVGNVDPNPKSGRDGDQNFNGTWYQSGNRYSRRGMQRVKRHLFLLYYPTNTPYVALKYAMTLDGKIAVKTGEVQMDHRRRGEGTCSVSQASVAAILTRDSYRL